MDWNFVICCFLISISQLVTPFNIDPQAWRYFSQNQDTAFGYKVIQKDASSLIISDPSVSLRPNERGKVYNCKSMNIEGTCTPLQITVPSDVANMSLGLSMTKDPQSSQFVVCGPTIPKECKTATTYSGMCFIIDEKNSPSVPIPRSLRDCPVPNQTDIAFLLDGSGSVFGNDFEKMKIFVYELITGLSKRDIKFALAQFSQFCVIHKDFKTFKSAEDVNVITQLGGGTRTAGAISELVDYVFTTQAGARPDANRVMIVITDGESQDSSKLPYATKKADQSKIIRYAIGVGRAFDKSSARRELEVIASAPSQKHTFKVDNFDLLNQISQTLEENIIAIEGTQTSGDSSKLEFAQDGFNAAFLPNTNIILSVVGAYQWKGGFQEYSLQGKPQTFQNGSEHDSYLGYALTVANNRYGSFIVLGAPRYGHKGRVIILPIGTTDQIPLQSPEPQIGAYYGAELCIVDLNLDSKADLLLVSAPLHMENDQEGKVFVYEFLGMAQRPLQHSQTLEGMAGQMGRFGSTVASPADLNGDGFTDVVIGAPLEDNSKGSIYIFNGRAASIANTFSQRISGTSVRSNLQFFGLALSETALDHSSDQLPDIAVGSKGTVVLLRSRPVVSVTSSLTYSPSIIPTKQTDCTTPLENTLHLCFVMSDIKVQDLSADIQYTLKLDATRQNSRAHFPTDKKRILSESVQLKGYQASCKDHQFFIEPCPEDALNPLSNILTFVFDGLPGRAVLKPALHPDTKNTSEYNLHFEKNCGSDNICTDNLKMDFNFSGSTDIKVGIMQDMNVTISVENTGENSYNSRVVLKYPYGLSFRRVTSKQGRVECTSYDSEQKVTQGATTCFISKPIFRENTQAIFEITYSINKNSDFANSVQFTGSVESDNERHTDDRKETLQKSIGVKYAIYIALIRHDNSSIHINFTVGKNNQQKPVHQVFKVENDLRDLNFTIYFRVPIKLGEKNIWSNLQINDCAFEKDEPPKNKDFAATLLKQPEMNCSVAVCKLFRCDARLLKRESKYYSISGNVSSEWIEQAGPRQAIYQLVSTATLQYDNNKYVFFSSDVLHIAPTGKINTQVELYEEKNLTKEIIGGVLGGLVILALVTVILYKTGFFKSQYKEMLENAEAGGNEAGQQAATPGSS